MNDLASKLQEIGIKNISEKTHITEKNLNAIANRDFASLHRTKALGFVRILQREYGLDFDEWLIEFYKYIHDSKIEPIEEKVFADKNLEQPNPQTGSKLRTLAYLLIAGATIAVGYLAFDNIKNRVDNESRELSIVKQSVEEAKTDLDETKELNNSELSMLFGSDKNDTEETNTTLDLNHSSMEFNQSNLSNQHNQDNLPISRISIVPKGSVWIGVVYLSNHKKKNVITKNPYEIDVTKNQLIITGHEKVDILVNDKPLDFNNTEKGKVRFLFKDGKISPISLDEFVEYNKGKNW